MAAALAGAIALAAPAPARAEEPAAPSAEARAAATRAFEEGERAFRAGDYVRAAGSFEEAYRVAPHVASLWNAARSWHRAGEIARAANLYARYLREAPADAPDRDAATAGLGQISPKLGKLEVFAPEAGEVRVDDQPVEGGSIYVNAGSHVISARKGDRELRRTEVVGAGEVRSIALVEEAAPSPSAPPSLSPSPSRPPSPSPPPSLSPSPSPSRSSDAATETATGGGRRGWSPTVVIIGASLTGASGLFTILSGLDTLKARDTFDAEPSQDNLDAGLLKQRRTNILIGTTAILGTLTGVAAIWLVDWGGKAKEQPPAASSGGATPARIRVGVGPGSVALGGSF